MRTLTGYLVGVFIVLTVINLIGWTVGGIPRVEKLGVFSIGFLLGAFGMYLAAHLYGYRQVR